MQPETRSGMGSGTPRQELERWMREAGKITVHDEGEQHELFGGTTRMYRLFNRAGDSVLISQATAEEYGLRPTTAAKPRPRRSENLFAAPQGFIFGEEV